MQAGITLIALVITIIVLLILAMVAISMLTGPNGLLTKSVEAKIENDKGAIKDQVETEVMGSYDKRGKIDWDLLEGNLEKNLGGLKKDSIRATEGEKEEKWNNI